MLYDLHFQFVPVAHVRDWRFAVTFYVFLVIAFVYSVGSMFFLHQYCFYSPATSLMTPWFTSLRNPSNVKSPPYYCNNASYDYLPSDEEIATAGNYTFRNTSCWWMNDAVVTNMASDAISITTASMVLRTDADNSSSTHYDCYFMTDLDVLTANFQHSVNMPIGPPVLNPPTIVYDSNGKVYKSFGHPGEQPFVSLSWRDILNIIGASPDQWNPQATRTFAPIRYRNTGMLIAVNLEYENAVNWEVPLQLRCKMTLELQAGSWGIIGWISPGKLNMLRVGLVLNFVVQGQLAAFSLTSLVTHLISSYVLIGVCRTAVVMLIKLFSATSDDFAKHHKLELRPEIFCSDCTEPQEGHASRSSPGAVPGRRGHSASFFVPRGGLIDGSEEMELRDVLVRTDQPTAVQ